MTWRILLAAFALAVPAPATGDLLSFNRPGGFVRLLTSRTHAGPPILEMK